MDFQRFHLPYPDSLYPESNKRPAGRPRHRYTRCRRYCRKHRRLQEHNERWKNGYCIRLESEASKTSNSPKSEYCSDILIYLLPPVSDNQYSNFLPGRRLFARVDKTVLYPIKILYPPHSDNKRYHSFEEQTQISCCK